MVNKEEFLKNLKAFYNVEVLSKIEVKEIIEVIEKECSFNFNKEEIECIFRGYI